MSLFCYLMRICACWYVIVQLGTGFFGILAVFNLKPESGYPDDPVPVPTGRVPSSSRSRVGPELFR